MDKPATTTTLLNASLALATASSAAPIPLAAALSVAATTTTVTPKSVPLVSVLVPIYNVQRYLEQCLESLCGQTLRQLEIICINDGSTDNSPQIIRRFAQQDQRFVVIDKPNAGYGHTMNCGLKAAKGEYIGIVESDDYIAPNMFETLYNAAQKSQAQIVKSDFFMVWTMPSRRQYFHAVPPQLSGKLVRPWQSYQVMQPQPSIWSALYSRRFLEDNSIDFLETPGAAYQDTSFNYMAWAAADRAFLLGDAFLYYRQDNSESSINSSRRALAVVDEISRSLRFIENYPERRWRLLQVMQGIIYKTYSWNLGRINTVLRDDFLTVMAKHFRTARAEGLLSPEFFEFDHYRQLQLLLDDPQSYLQRLNSGELSSGMSKLRRLAYYLRREGLSATLRRATSA